MDRQNRAESPKRIEQLDEDYDHNSVVENPADLTIHGNVVVHQLKQHPHNDQGDNKGNQIHRQDMATLRA